MSNARSSGEESKHILIIGGTRFIGPYVVRRLDHLGYRITLFHRGQTESDLPDGVRHIHGDRRRLKDFEHEFRRLAPQIVLDMVPGTKDHARSVMGLFKGVAQRIVAISSLDVYRAFGKLIQIESGPAEPLPLSEGSPLRQQLYPYRSQAMGPENERYHYEKILAEQVFMGEPGLAGTVLRLPMVYGPGDRAHRLFKYLKRMDDNRPAIILDEGMAAWRWTKGYVENVAAAAVLAVTADQAAGRIYNVGEKEALTEAEWVEAIGKAAGWKGKVVILPRGHLPEHLRPDIDTDQHVVVDTSRMRQELGYEEVVSNDKAMRRTVDWERAHPPEKLDPKLFDYPAEDALLSKVV